MRSEDLEDKPQDDTLEVFTVRLDRTMVRRLDRLCYFVPGANRSTMVRDLVKLALNSAEETLVQMVARWQRDLDAGVLKFMEEKSDPTQIDSPSMERPR